MLSDNSDNMFKTLRILSLIFLLFNGLSAIYGGISLILKPDGSLLQMHLSFLEYTPFENYLIPGLILFIFNGLLSLVAAWVTLKKIKKYPSLILLQGVIMLGWIIIEILMLKVFEAFLHLPFLITGSGLVIAGTFLIIKFENDIRKRA